MKKILNLLVILCFTLALTGCGNNETIDKTKTIVLEVDTSVVPVFTSNFGSGTYDSTTKKYTHTISYVKDLYISLSYEDLKTVTVHVPTKDMDEDVITKQVEFGKVLDAEIKVTVEGVKSLEGITFDQSLQYSNLQIGKKNTFKLTLPSREQDYNLKFTLPNYRPFDIEITSDDLVSGSADVNVPAITTSQVYIGFEGNQYQYKIYSYTTNKLVASGNNYYDTNKTQYVLLNNDDRYYVKVDNYNGQMVYKVEQGQDKIIKIRSDNYGAQSYLDIRENNNNSFYNDTYIYHKKTNLMRYGSNFYGNIEDIGLIIEKEGNFLYLDDVASKATKHPEYTYNYTYHINESDFVPVSLDITRIDRYTNESFEKNSYYFNDMQAAIFENNIFKITVYEVREGYLKVQLKDEEGNVIEEKDNIHISSYFQGIVYSDRITTKEGKIVPYQFPIFYEEMTMESCNEYECDYTYPAQTIDTSASYTMIKIMTEYGYATTVDSYSNAYLIDDEQEIIMGTNINDTLYFELTAGKEYTLHYNDRSYDFTATEAVIGSGNVIIYPEGTSFISVKIDQDIRVKYREMNFMSDAEGIIQLPLMGENNSSDKEDSITIYLSNSYITDRPCYITLDGRDVYEVHLYALAKGNFNSYDNPGSNQISYESLVINPDSNQYLMTALYVYTNGHYDQSYKVSIDKFEYDSEYEAYVFDVASEFDHVIQLSNITTNSLNAGTSVVDYPNNIVYINSDSYLYYNGRTYKLESYTQYKHLRVHLNDGTGELEITPIID